MDKDNLKFIPVKSMSELIVGERYYISYEGVGYSNHNWEGIAIFRGMIARNEGYGKEVGSFTCENSHEFDKDKEDDGVFSLDNIVGRIVDPNSDVRAFFRPKDPLLHDDIMFGMYAPDRGGTSGEMVMRWKTFGDGKQVPQLRVYDDAWKVLATFKDVLDELAKVDNKNITQEEFVYLLTKCGFEDFTSGEIMK